jgi:hypothetical protein
MYYHRELEAAVNMWTLVESIEACGSKIVLMLEDRLIPLSQYEEYVKDAYVRS